MHHIFLKLNSFSLVMSILVQYIFIYRLKFTIGGYLLSFCCKYSIEIVVQVIYIWKYSPEGILVPPSFSDFREGLMETFNFIIYFIISYAAEYCMFELVTFILFQTKTAQENISIWVCIYQILAICNSFTNMTNTNSKLIIG